MGLCYIHRCSWGRSCVSVMGRPVTEAEPALPCPALSYCAAAWLSGSCTGGGGAWLQAMPWHADQGAGGAGPATRWASGFCLKWR